MKSQILIALTLGALCSCEGEPPKTAAGEVTTAPPDTTAAPQTTETDEEAHHPGMGNKAGCCNCGCTNGSGAVAAAGDGGAPTTTDDAGAQQPVATADAAAPAATQADIVGTVEATPAYLSSTAVVWLDDAPKDPARGGMHGRIDNHQMTFSPFVQVITVGGTVQFVNSDPFPHNVFSPDGDKFNMGTINQNSASGARKFDKPGTFTLLCNLHPGMIGYLVVSPSSYFARTDARGHYRIKNVPAGTYKITAWAPRLPTVTQSVTVGEGEAKMDFELHR